MLQQGVAERPLQAAEVSKGPTHPTHRWCPQVQLLCDGVHHHGQGFRRAPHHGLGLSIAMKGLLIHHWRQSGKSSGPEVGGDHRSFYVLGAIGSQGLPELLT
jgi:hypothetical protein